MRAHRVLIAFVLVLALGVPLAIPAPAVAGDDLLGILPANSTGVFSLDIKKGLATPFGKKLLEEKGDDYLKFIAETGLDPEKDFDRLVGSIILHGEDDWDFVLAIKGNFDQEKLMKAGMSSGAELKASTHRDLPLIRIIDPITDEDDGDTGDAASGEEEWGDEGDYEVSPDTSWAAFLDESTILWGGEGAVKATIDVYTNNAEGMHTNEGLTALVGQTKTDAIAWGIFEIPEEMAQGLAAESPMMASLADLRSIILMIDYEDETILGLIHANGGTAEKNAQLAEFLTGMKAFFAMGAAEDPDLAELLESIRITSSDQHVAIEMAIPEELMQRITDSAVEKAGGPDKGDIE